MLKIIEFIRPLFCESKSGFSLGRVSWWVVLYPAISLWISGKDIQSNHLYILGFLLIYNCYKKLPQLIEFVKALRGKE